MKRISTKISLVFIITAMLLSCFSKAFAADSYINLNGFSFDINDNGEAVIHEYNGSATKVVVPEKLLGAYVSTIDSYAFFNNTKITSVSFENATHLETIGVNAFYGCSKLKALTIPSSVGTIEFGAFQNCSGLERVQLGNGISSIPSQAFLNCSSLFDLEIPESVNSIAENAFNGCDKLVIYCYEFSYAQQFAEEHNIKYILLDKYDLGDVDLNGRINIRDVSYIQLYVLGKYKLPAFRYADVNHDGKVNIRDVTMIQLYLVGRIDLV